MMTNPLRNRRLNGQSQPHLYESVKAEVRQRITSGVYLPGAKIPSERELISEFRVSAITVRRAIRDLTGDELLFSRQGLGVFVTDSRHVIRALTSDIMTTLEDDMRRAGVVPGLKVLSLELTREPTMADRLGLPSDSRLYRLQKIILGDGHPVVLDTAFLSRALGDALRPEITEERFLFPLLVTHGLSIDHVRFRVTGDTVTAGDAAALGLTRDFPTLVLDYTVLGSNAVPILTGRAVSRADRLGYQFDVHPGLQRADLRAQPAPNSDAPGLKRR
jgi:DNA-binding GntR family transcriptional regulator